MARDETPTRLASLDQFRGYTVAGMFLVNFAGGFVFAGLINPFDSIPDLIRHHHTHFSYADSIMPQFLFAVGFALRLTFLKRWRTSGPWAAYRRAFVRVGGLLLFGVIYHRLSGGARTWDELQKLGVEGFFRTAFQRNPFETLTHIAVTSLWVLPVIAAGPLVRVAYAVFSAALFWYLSQHHGYYTWVVTRPGIDGGPLGFLTWTTPLLVGSLAYDAVVAGSPRAIVGKLLLWAGVLMALGYGLSCLSRVLDPESPPLLAAPPFVAPGMPKQEYHKLSKQPENARHMFWVMSQRAGSPSYLVFGAGFSLALYALFVLVCDLGGFRLALLETLGANALAAYIVHDMVSHTLHPYTPKDAPWWFALASFGVFFALCYVLLRHLEKHKLFLRL